jgi:hypothetical protein
VRDAIKCYFSASQRGQNRVNPRPTHMFSGWRTSGFAESRLYDIASSGTKTDNQKPSDRPSRTTWASIVPPNGLTTAFTRLRRYARSPPPDLRTGGVFPAATLNTSRMLYSDHSTRRTNRGRETMRDDPWTAANRVKEQRKVTIPPKRKQTAETASPPSKPTVSGPFWTGKKSAPDVPKPQGIRDARQRTDD